MTRHASNGDIMTDGASARSDKREERRRRAEQAQEARVLRVKQQVLRRRVLIAAGILIAVAFVWAATHRGSAPAGRVWSPEHGHWHDQ
ncbi:MAG: hypothetical protein IT360_21760 [Gemmatimonadaceae bacterium]|nr:hypothetical protein [Gemmatimonadaceae bacterium]